MEETFLQITDPGEIFTSIIVINVAGSNQLSLKTVSKKLFQIRSIWKSGAFKNLPQIKSVL